MKILAAEILSMHPVLKSKLISNCSISESEIEYAFGELLKYLYVNSISKEKCTPSILVDKMWHEFILFTRLYSDFCKRQYGKFIHHQPGGSESENKRQYVDTITRIQNEYGPVDENYWPISHLACSDFNCGSCD